MLYGMQGSVTASAMAAKWRYHALLRRLVVVRHRQQQRIDAGARGLAAQLDAVGGAVVARAGDHRRARADDVLHLGPEADLLGDRQRRRLAGGAGDDEAVGAGVEQRDRQPPRLRVVDGAVGYERRDHGGEDPAEFHV